MAPPANPLRSPAAPDRAARLAGLEFAVLLLASTAPGGWFVLRGLVALAG